MPRIYSASCVDGMAFSRAANDFKLARQAAEEEAAATRMIAELEADPDIVHADSWQEDKVVVEAEATLLQARQQLEAAKAAALAAKVLSR